MGVRAHRDRDGAPRPYRMKGVPVRFSRYPTWPAPPRCPATGKVRYLSGEHAEVALMELERRPSRQADGAKPIRMYGCTACGGWHLTSKPLAFGPTAERGPA